MVGRGGLEPPTSRLSGVRSNHLSYRPDFRLAKQNKIKMWLFKVTDAWWSLGGSNS
ncbi:unnamed protein product [Chrysoparadoxa australica]